MKQQEDKSLYDLYERHLDEKREAYNNYLPTPAKG